VNPAARRGVANKWCALAKPPLPRMSLGQHGCSRDRSVSHGTSPLRTAWFRLALGFIPGFTPRTRSVVRAPAEVGNVRQVRVLIVDEAGPRPRRRVRDGAAHASGVAGATDLPVHSLRTSRLLLQGVGRRRRGWVTCRDPKQQVELLGRFKPKGPSGKAVLP